MFFSFFTQLKIYYVTLFYFLRTYAFELSEETPSPLTKAVGCFFESVRYDLRYQAIRGLSYRHPSYPILTGLGQGWNTNLVR